jgi:hypothetical protein
MIGQQTIIQTRGCPLCFQAVQPGHGRELQSVVSPLRNWFGAILREHLAALLGALFMTSLVVPAADTNAPSASATDYQGFKLIVDRNIFNQNRFPGSAQRVRVPEKQVVTETFSLMGTIRYAKGDFAFFDGSSSEYKKVLKASDMIGGYKISQVGHSSVKLASTNKEVELPVGMQMKRQDQGEWQLTARSESERAGGSASGESSSRDRDSSRSREGRDTSRDGSRNRDFTRRERFSSNSPGSSSNSPAPANNSQEASGGGSPDEVLKRLMERRRQE